MNAYKGMDKRDSENTIKRREAAFNNFWNAKGPKVKIEGTNINTPEERVYAWFYANRTKKDRMPGTNQGTECYPKYDGHEYPVVIYKKNTDKNGNLIVDKTQFSKRQLSKMAKQWLQSIGRGDAPDNMTVYDVIDDNIFSGLDGGYIKAPNEEEQQAFMEYYKNSPILKGGCEMSGIQMD